MKKLTPFIKNLTKALKLSKTLAKDIRAINHKFNKSFKDFEKGVLPK